MALDLPPDHGPARDEAILAYIRAGAYTADLRPVATTCNGKTVTLYVFGDALKIEGVRVNVSAKLQQTIADMLGCSLMTPKVADLAWAKRSVTLIPYPRPITSSTTAMIAHSADIDKALAKHDLSGVSLVQTVGKHWVIDNDLQVKTGRAENYGWHFVGPNFQGLKGEPVASLQKDVSGQYQRLIQGRGWAHDIEHVDYSQVCVLMSQMCEVDGQNVELRDLLTDPVLSIVASHQGMMRVFRQPGVAVTPLHEFLMPTIEITGGGASAVNIS